VIHVLVPAADDEFTSYLDAQGRRLAPRTRIVHYEEIRSRLTPGPGVYVFTALDRVGPAMLQRARECSQQLAATPGARILNDPSRHLGRFALLEALWRSGRNDFRAARPWGDVAALRFPVFLRDERSHDGALSPLLHSHADLNAWVGRAILLGVRRRDLLVIEFCDTADDTGLYRKYGAFVVGGRVFLRSLLHAPTWMVKRTGAQLSRAQAAEEAAYAQANPHRAELTDICAMAGIDYGRVDYAFRKGRLQVWEINSNPTLGRHGGSRAGAVSPEVEAARRESKANFHAAFEAAWEAIDVPGPAETPSRGRGFNWRKAIVPRVGRERWRHHLQRALRPIGPALAPLATPVCGWIGRMARANKRG
jgi:hypothetical protein